MGLYHSSLNTLEISCDDIKEIFRDHMITNQSVLLFEKEICDKCFEILTRVKNDNNKCRVYYYGSEILVVEDPLNNYQYVSQRAQPTAFGFVFLGK